MTDGGAGAVSVRSAVCGQVNRKRLIILPVGEHLRESLDRVHDVVAGVAVSPSVVPV
jgi:hypothetical protein